MSCSTYSSQPKDASVMERWKRKFKKGKAKLKNAIEASSFLEKARQKTCGFIDKRRLETDEVVFEPHDIPAVEELEPPQLQPISVQCAGASLEYPEPQIDSNEDDARAVAATRQPVAASTPMNRLSECLACVSTRICGGESKLLDVEATDVKPITRSESLKFHMIVHGVSFDETDDTKSIRTPASARSVLHTIVSRSHSWLGPVPEIPDFSGTWICTSTWGLDAFLEKCGISKFQRLAATRAPWPSWEFRQDGHAITFINNGAFGALQEMFVVGGPDFTVIDGRKQKLICQAYWENSTLVIERSGPHGRFREERAIRDDGTLHLSLSSLEKDFGNISWGRTFERKKKKKQS